MTQLIGEIILFPYNDVPHGWLKCEGQSLHISMYPKLFTLIGTKFGKGDDNEFKLPDLTNKAPKGLIYCIAIAGVLPKI